MFWPAMTGSGASLLLVMAKSANACTVMFVVAAGRLSTWAEAEKRPVLLPSLYVAAAMPELGRVVSAPEMVPPVATKVIGTPTNAVKSLAAMVLLAESFRKEAVRALVWLTSTVEG